MGCAAFFATGWPLLVGFAAAGLAVVVFAAEVFSALGLAAAGLAPLAAGIFRG